MCEPKFQMGDKVRDKLGGVHMIYDGPFRRIGQPEKGELYEVKDAQGNKHLYGSAFLELVPAERWEPSTETWRIADGTARTGWLFAPGELEHRIS